jgi:hypothetical protein
MPAFNTRVPGLFLALAVLALPPGSARAQSVYDVLFGSPAQRAPRVEVAPSPYLLPFFEVERQPTRRRSDPDRHRLRGEEFAAPPPVMPTKAKTARITPDRELVASIMADSTLRRGDIVVFPDGPRVYRGNEGSSQRASDFEDLRRSRLVGDSTRKAVLAATRSIDTPITVADNTKRRPQNRDRGEDVAVTGAIATTSAP